MTPKSKFTLRWNEQCAQAIKDNKHAFNRCKKHETTKNLVNFKKLRAITRKTLKNSKRQAWINYVSSLNSATLLSSISKKNGNNKRVHHTNAIPALVKKDNSLT